MRHGAAALLLCVLATAASAGEAERDAAARLPALFEAGDDETIDALATGLDPRPWGTLEVLRANGRPDLAIEFAKRATAPNGAGLLAYAEARAEVPLDPARCDAALLAETRLYEDTDSAGTLEILEPLDRTTADVLSIGLLGLEWQALENTGEHDRAIAAAQSALRLANEIEWPLGRAYAEASLSHLFARRQKHAEAATHARRAVEHFGVVGLKSEEARAWNVLGTQHVNLLEFRQGRRALERARALHEARRADATTDTERRRIEQSIAAALNNLGKVALRSGDIASALTYFEDARDRYEKARSARGVSISWLNIGQIRQLMRDLSGAVEATERAIAVLEPAGPRARPSLARAYETLAGIRAGLSESDHASDLIGRAIRIYEDLGRPADAARAQATAAILAVDAGEVDTALSASTRALQRLRELDASVESICHAKRAVAYAALRNGDVDLTMETVGSAVSEARRAGLRGMEFRLRRLRLDALWIAGDQTGALAESLDTARLANEIAAGLSVAESINHRQDNARILRIGIEAARLLKRPKEWLRLAEYGRGRSLAMSLGGNDALADLPIELTSERDAAAAELAAAKVRATDASAAGVLKAAQEARAALVRATERVQRADARLERRRAAVTGLLDLDPPSIAELQSVLREGDVVAVYARGTDTASALVVTPEQARLVDLGPVAELADALAPRLHELPDESVEAVLSAIRVQLIEPLSLPSGTTRLMLCSDELTHTAPTEAFFDQQAVVRIPSVRAFVELSQRRARPSRFVLAIGDPKYDALPPAPGRSSAPSLASLPESGREALAVGDVSMVGAAAAEAVLRSELRRGERWKSIHFACHGLVDAETPMLSALVLSPGAGEDGYLTAHELAGLEVDTDLVVMSACDSGRGTDVAGEGLVGLTWAALVAGSPRVVASLWRVDDRATRVFMESFYATWLDDGVPVEEALRRARAHVRRTPGWEHPRYWAAWTLTGVGD